MIWVLLLVSGAVLDPLEPRVQTGRTHYEFYKSSGSCWESAIQSMASACSSMDESTQSLFAAKLTNCHLKRLNLPELKCAVGDCEMDQKTYIAYTQFFTHSFDICVYLSYQDWQVRTQKMISELSLTSAQALNVLQSSHKIGQEIYEKQLEVSQKIDLNIKIHEKLQNEIGKSREEMAGFVKDFMNSSREVANEINKQQEFIGNWFNKVYNVLGKVVLMQESILNELWDLNSVVFFGVFVGALAAVTSLPETFDQRSKVFCLAGAELFVERAFCLDYKMIRAGFVLLCGLVVLVGVKRYKRYDKMSYGLLEESLKRLNEAFYVFTPSKNRNCMARIEGWKGGSLSNKMVKY